MTQSTKKLGDAGEEAAANYLMNKGYKILARNFRYSRNAEIDIIVEINAIIVFVEVKTRSSNKFGTPAEAVEIHKQRKIIMAAKNFLRENRFFDRACRFDVIEVFAGYDFENWQINHIENAFEVE